MGCPGASIIILEVFDERGTRYVVLSLTCCLLVLLKAVLTCACF
jgi:hypothetical protein